MVPHSCLPNTKLCPVPQVTSLPHAGPFRMAQAPGWHSWTWIHTGSWNSRFHNCPPGYQVPRLLCTRPPHAAWTQAPGSFRYQVGPCSRLSYKDPSFRPNTTVTFTMPAPGDPATRPAPSGTQHQANPHRLRTEPITGETGVRLTLKQGHHFKYHQLFSFK